MRPLQYQKILLVWLFAFATFAHTNRHQQAPTNLYKLEQCVNGEPCYLKDYQNCNHYTHYPDNKGKKILGMKYCQDEEFGTIHWAACIKCVTYCDYERCKNYFPPPQSKRLSKQHR